MSLHSSSRSNLTEFTFCNISEFNDSEKPYNDEHPFVPSPFFEPKMCYSGYNCSSRSTKARNRILELMTNLPESDQELSLKDIVLEDLEKEQTDQKIDLKTGLKVRKASKQERPISRSVSLDTGVFMLKMFNPISCGMKKSQSSSRMCSKSNNINSSSNSNSKGSKQKSKNRSVTSKTKSRSAELTPGCWFTNKPWKSTSQRGWVV